MTYSRTSLIKDLLADERACAIIEAHLPGATSHPAVDDAEYMTVGEVMGMPQVMMFRGKFEKILSELAALEGGD